MNSGLTTMRAASLRRYEDAEALLGAERWLGARYLYGYWVDKLEDLNPVLGRRFALKADPQIHRTHSASWITAFHPGFIRLRDTMQLRKSESELLRRLNLVASWSSELHYSPNPSSRAEAECFKEAAQVVVNVSRNF
ncbi:MAG: hypothetical protein RIT28_5109 [Pseudomonadota bacterium]